MVGRVLLILGVLVLYMVAGAVLAGLARRKMNDRERMELDDLLGVFIFVWPAFAITKPLMALYRWIGRT